MDGESYTPPFTMTWPAVSGTCAGTLVFTGKFAEDGSDHIDAADFIAVHASVDGAPAVNILEFRGNGGINILFNGAFAVDSDGDGIGGGGGGGDGGGAGARRDAPRRV